MHSPAFDIPADAEPAKRLCWEEDDRLADSNWSKLLLQPLFLLSVEVAKLNLDELEIEASGVLWKTVYWIPRREAINDWIGP